VNSSNSLDLEIADRPRGRSAGFSKACALSAPYHSTNQREQKQNYKDKEQNLGYTGCCYGNASETEDGRDQSHDKER
jgi:hypothetical protein